MVNLITRKDRSIVILYCLKNSKQIFMVGNKIHKHFLLHSSLINWQIDPFVSHDVLVIPYGI